MYSKNREIFLALGQMFFFIAIFSFDILLPLGVAAGVPYVAPILLTYYSRNYATVFISASTATILTIVGYLVSETGGIHWMVLMNRAIALFAIWSTAALIINHHNKSMALVRNLNIIDQNIKIAEFGLDGTITDISNDLCRYLGTTKEEMIGTQPDFFYQTISSTALQKIWAIIKSGKTWRGEVRRVTPTGEIKWACSSIHPTIDSDSNIICFNNFLDDITDKKALETISLTDSLTSLPNRRFFDETLDREIKLAQRGRWSLTLAVIDIDFFKEYNDYYGHLEGDKVLTRVANTLKEAMRRPGDYICRIGGEEFAIFFSQTGASESEGLLLKICRAIEDAQIPHAQSRISQFLTVSIGAHVCAEGCGILAKEELFKKADAALYTAKEKRNKVVLSAGSMHSPKTK